MLIESLAMFLASTNFDVQKKATECLWSLGETTHIFKNNERSFKDNIQYCQYISNVLSSLELDKLNTQFEPQSNEELLNEDERQNHHSMAYQLCIGLGTRNEIIAPNMVHLFVIFHVTNRIKVCLIPTIVAPNIKVFVADNLNYTCSKWIEKKYPIRKYV